MDLRIDPSGDKEQVFKSNPDTRTPRMRVILKGPEAIPFLSPNPALLLKVRHCQIKDQFDFETALPQLNIDENC